MRSIKTLLSLVTSWQYLFSWILRALVSYSCNRQLTMVYSFQQTVTISLNNKPDPFSTKKNPVIFLTTSDSSSSDTDSTATNKNEKISASNGNDNINEDIKDLLMLPNHSNEDVNKILSNTEVVIKGLHKHSRKIEPTSILQQKAQEQNNGFSSSNNNLRSDDDQPIYANTYVDMGKVDVVGFDYDYTLATYTSELLELIYEMALNRLVEDRRYPEEMLEAGLTFDPFFSIRGLAVDKETGWICHLSYTHKVAVAWEGREKLPTSRIYEEYRLKRALNPIDRKKRLKPLNDLFSMAECCLIADTIQFFKDNNYEYCPKNTATDIISAVRETHISGDFHRLVASNPEKYFDPAPHLKEVLESLKNAGKRLIFASNSPFWYVDAGMKYIIDDNWKNDWDVVITSAGKPNFYTEDARPFRELNEETGRVKFQQVKKLEPGKVYTEGCLRDLTRLMKWDDDEDNMEDGGGLSFDSGADKLETSNVLYIGDSLFADLVDAKREYGWTTAAVTPEVGYEMDILKQPDLTLARRTINLLLNALRLIQEELGSAARLEEDIQVLNDLERLVSKWRDRETALLGNPFGSVFSARYQPSLFAHSLRRYCDLYMSSVSNLRHYSPQHRFYPEQDARLLAHEIQNAEPECWDLEDVIEN